MAKNTVKDWTTDFCNSCLQKWWQVDDKLPAFFRKYSVSEQQKRENELQEFLDEILLIAADDVVSAETFKIRFFTAFIHFGRGTLEFEQDHLDMFFKQGFSKALADFVKAARKFDSTLSGEAIYQAARNVCTMNGIQYLMGLPVRLTPSIFAYSLIYPYSDNLLDDSATTTTEKRRFNHRFRNRLDGHSVEPQSNCEDKIYRLVDMIEDEYDRIRYPGVYQSLLAIQGAQEKSVLLLCEKAQPFNIDILGIAIEKGGASVLADGMLVAGTIDKATAEFLFEYGAFLQLVDDLQDVSKDRKNGLATIFSCTSRQQLLQLLINRAFHFGRKISSGLKAVVKDYPNPLSDLIYKSGDMLLLDAVGRSQRWIDRGYLKTLQPYFPFRYDRLYTIIKTFARKRHSLQPLFKLFD
jgi:hypothetical protein